LQHTSINKFSKVRADLGIEHTAVPSPILEQPLAHMERSQHPDGDSGQQLIVLSAHVDLVAAQNIFEQTQVGAGLRNGQVHIAGIYHCLFQGHKGPAVR